jgi:hypothetical protein
MNRCMPAVAVVVTLGAGVASLASAGSTLSTICEELRGLPVTEAHSLGEVPARAKPLLKRMKGELHGVVSSIVATVGATPDSDGLVRERLMAALAERGVAVGDEPDISRGLGYGYVVDVGARMPPGHARLLGVTVTLSIPCGSDSSLYLFRSDVGRWAPVLKLEVDGYDVTSEAQGAFGYDVSPAAPDGSFLILTASIGPWCTSVWQPLRYHLFRVPPSPAPAVLLRSGSTGLTAADEGYEITPERDGFTLAYKVNDTEAPGMRIPERLRLRVRGEEVSEARSRSGE